MIWYYINYITKLKFLLVFKVAFQDAIIKNNIYSSFWGTRLVLYNLEGIILKLEIRPKILTSSVNEEAP